MKKNRAISLICALFFIVSLLVPSFASSPRASDQIKMYWMDTTATEGAINISFSMTGKVIMDKLGCESIYIYEKVGTAWVYDNGKTENNTGMSATQRGNHGNTITFSGTAGVEYMVVVTLFAENSAGRDTRSQTFYVTGK